jgi:hypothetical protein
MEIDNIMSVWKAYSHRTKQILDTECILNVNTKCLSNKINNITWARLWLMEIMGVVRVWSGCNGGAFFSRVTSGYGELVITFRSPVSMMVSMYYGGLQL